MFDVFSLSARNSVTQAHQEARTRGNGYIGTEHLLLGVLGGDDEAVRAVLAAVSLDPVAVRSRLDDVIGSAAAPEPGHLPFSCRAKSALERSRDEATAGGRDLVEPADILAAVLADEQSGAAKVIASLVIRPTELGEYALKNGDR